MYPSHALNAKGCVVAPIHSLVVCHQLLLGRHGTPMPSVQGLQLFNISAGCMILQGISDQCCEPIIICYSRFYFFNYLAANFLAFNELLFLSLIKRYLARIRASFHKDVDLGKLMANL